MYQLKIDSEFKNLIPPLSGEEKEYLEQNIKTEGCRDALVVWNGTIVDGHNRYETCTRLNIPFKVENKDFKDRSEAVEWIIRNQFGRRNITNAVRAILALRLEPIIREKAKKNQSAAGGDRKSDNAKSLVQNSAKANQRTSTGGSNPRPLQNSAEAVKTREEVAKLAGVSHDTIDKVKYITKNGTPEQIERIKQGGKGNSINAVRGEIIQEKHPEKKVCKKCGIAKEPSEFYAGKAVCKQCLSACKPTKDIKGDPIRSDPATDAIADKIAQSMYDTEKEIDYSVDDLVEELNSLTAYFSRNTRSSIDTHKDLLSTEENKQKIMTALSEAETVIQKIKEILS